MSKSSGFLTLQLCLYILAGMGVVLLLSWGGLWLQTQRLEAVQSAYDGFVAKVAAEGQEQEKRTKETIARNQKSKERTDAENKRLRSANQSLADELRRARADGRLVSPAPAATSRPDLACFDRAYLEHTLSRFVEGAARLVEEGDAHRTDLSSVRAWAEGR